MFDEIFKRWIETGRLNDEDIVPLFLEYNQTFGDKQATAEHVLFMLTHLMLDYTHIINYMLKTLSIQKGYNWEELIDKNGIVIKRFFV
jgi:hypothetical protein